MSSSQGTHITHTHINTDGHGDSKTNSAKRAELVKIEIKKVIKWWS